MIEQIMIDKICDDISEPRKARATDYCRYIRWLLEERRMTGDTLENMAEMLETEHGIVEQLRAANTNLMTYERDHEAMEVLRADDGYNGCLDQVEDSDGTILWEAEVGPWGIATSNDPAEAIFKANKVNQHHKMLNPIKMEEK